MATLRALLRDAFRMARAIGLGDDPVADELDFGVSSINDLIADIHEARGPLLNVDATASLVASENQRIRIQAGATITVTLPNSIPIYGRRNPYDYGFTAPTTAAPVGSTAIADGLAYRAPVDGTRIEIVGTTQSLYWYRSDLNAWQSALSLTADSESPFNNRLNSAVSALAAERMWPEISTQPMTAEQKSRVGRARIVMFMRPGRDRAETRPSFV